MKLQNNDVAKLRQRDAKLAKLANPLEETRKVALKYYKCLDTPVALSCYLLLLHGEYDQLVTKEVLPSNYLQDAMDHFRRDYAAVKFLSKCRGLPTTFDLTLNAKRVEAWAEAKCKASNQDILDKNFSVATVRVIDIAKNILNDILRDPPTINEIVQQFRFGPGESTATKSPDTTIVAKVSSQLHCTSKAQADLAYAVQLQPMLAAHRPDVLDFCGPLCGPLDKDLFEYSIWTTAPKNAKTHRGISTQIHGLMLGQKALGRITRSRAKTSRYHIDLDNLWDTNQYFAYLGSIDDFYVTVDVKCASSTICYELPYLLLRRSWAMLYDRWREDFTHYDYVPPSERTVDYISTPHKNHKFSAMGNGYTFELESILFFALAKACAVYTKSNAFVSSFGDDIIIPKAAYKTLCLVFSELGLTVNSEKTFSQGCFRESCGGDYWFGTDVKPVYLKELLHNEISLAKLANRIRDYSSRFTDYNYCDVRMRPIWRYVIDRLQDIQSNFSIGSRGYGDMVVWASPGETKLDVPIYCDGVFYTRLTRFKNKNRRIKESDRLIVSWTLQKHWDMCYDLTQPLRSPYKPKRLYGIPSLDAIVTQHMVNDDTVTSLPRSCRGVLNKLDNVIGTSSVMLYPPQKWL